MNKLAILCVFPICNIITAQVPRQEREGTYDGYNSDAKYVNHSQAYSENTAPDNVKAVLFENDSKRSFLMGDGSKKGLYDDIKLTTDNKSYIVKKNNLYGLANQKGNIISEIKFDSIGSNYLFKESYVVKVKGEYGLVSNEGKIIIPIKNNKIYTRKEHLTILKNNKNEIEIIFNKSKKSFNKKIDYVELYHNLAIIKADGDFGVIIDDGILPLKYDSIYTPLKEVDAYYENKKNTTNNTNQVVITNTKSNFLAVKKGDKVGLINSKGEIILPVEYDNVFNNELLGYYTAKKVSLYAIYFIKNQRLSELEFDRVKDNTYSSLFVVKNNKMGVLNLEGDQIIPIDYDIDSFYDYGQVGYRISKNNKRGIVNKKGQVIVEPIYDDVEILSYNNSDFFSVKLEDKFGVVNKNNSLIIPVEYQFISKLNDNFLVSTFDQKFELYDKNGNKITKEKYKEIYKTATTNSNVIILKKNDDSINFLNDKNELIFEENVVDFGYVLNEEKLNSPIGRNGLIFVKNKQGKYALFDEISGTLKTPFTYDEIIQCTNTGERTVYYSVKKGKKYGLISSNNEVILPFEYDAIDLDFATSTLFFEVDYSNINQANQFQIVVAKGKNYGTVNLKNEVVISLKHTFLKRLSSHGFFKAKVGNKFQILDKEGKLVTKELFNEVANFERIHKEYSDELIFQGLTFKDGKMRVLDNNGNFITEEVVMSKHKGFETFNELKWELIKALDSKDDKRLKEFVDKISPSDHLLHYLKINIFSNNPLDINVEYVKEKYYEHLIAFKYDEWLSGYTRSSLYVDDYTTYSSTSELVTNKRTEDLGYGNSNFMENLLRNSIKVNGYWISSFFMDRRFY